MWHAKSINGQDHTLKLTDHYQVKDMWLLQLAMATAWWQPNLARHPHAKGTGLLISAEQSSVLSAASPLWCCRVGVASAHSFIITIIINLKFVCT